MTAPKQTAERLTPEHADAYRAIRAEMLLDSPASFLSGPGDDRFEPAGAAEEYLASDDRVIFGVFDPELVSVVGVGRNTRPKIRHFTEIWGVYTTQAARGKGFGRACMTAAIDWARTGGAHAIRLGVSETAPAARGLYESLGFVAWGTEPDSMLVDGRMHAEIYMQLRL